MHDCALSVDLFDSVDVFDCAVADLAQAQIIQADKYFKKLNSAVVYVSLFF